MATYENDSEIPVVGIVGSYPSVPLSGTTLSLFKNVIPSDAKKKKENETGYE